MVKNMDDYHAFNSTSDHLGGDGCLSWNAVIIIMVICAILTLMGKCSG